MKIIKNIKIHLLTLISCLLFPIFSQASDEGMGCLQIGELTYRIL